MNTITKRTTAGTLALALCLGGGALAFAGTAQAVAPTGDDRTIVIATGAVPFDAIAAGPYASLLVAPILLQPSSTELDPTIGYYLGKAVDAKDPVKAAVIVGGEAAVAPAIVDQLRRRGIEVHRISGQDRYATALNVALETDALLDG